MILGLPLAAADLASCAGVTSWIAAALWLVTAVAAADASRRLRGTTLMAPAVWAAISALSLSTVEAILAFRTEWADAQGAAIARYGVAVGTFCPVMAVLGAKRPQDRGWQWVVLSLWIVLLVPAGQALTARSAGEFTISSAWRLLLYVLIWAAPANYLATRWAPTAIVFAISQCALLMPYLVSGYEYEGASPALLLIVVAWQTWFPRRDATADASTALERFNRRWLAFRNNWGAFWGLRILNRINESAELSGWPVRLEWGGFAPIKRNASVEIDERVTAHIEQTMDSLLRRFERLETKPA